MSGQHFIHGHCLRCGRIVGNAHTEWCDAISRLEEKNEALRAELAERKATTPAPKPDCRTCAHVYTDMESYGCKRSTTIIVCIKGDGYVPSLPVRLYETGGE